MLSDEAMWFAIGEYLSSWPEDMTHTEVVDALENGHPDVDIWEPFENFAATDVCVFIDDLAIRTQQLIDKRST